MLFSELINNLKLGLSELQEYNIASDPEINSAASLDLAHKKQITFLEEGNKFGFKLNQIKADAILLPDNKDLISVVQKRNLAWAVFKYPRLAFAESLDFLYPKVKYKEGVHPTAVIGLDVEIQSNVYIGANVSIGNNIKIGRNSIIHPGVVIYDNVIIGEASELHANCVIHPKSIIGDQCIIHSNSVIGSEGFGFVPTKNGWRKMPQTGIVILEKEVEIGSGTTVDRPAVGKTIIGEGTKIDNLVQIGHGVKTGKNCAMASQVGIAGGAQIGDNVILAGQVGVANRVKVGSNVVASSKCGIHTDIDPGQVISGFPAIPNRLWLRCSSTFKQLPEIAKSLKELKRNLSK